MSTAKPAHALVPATAGAAAGVVYAVTIRRRPPAHQLPLATAGLAAAAVIYPLARPRGTGATATRTREWLAVATTVAIGAVAARLPRRTGHAVAAAGWAAHAGFDFAHDRGPTSRLPAWYPAFCAGFDCALAAALMAPGVERASNLRPMKCGHLMRSYPCRQPKEDA